MVPEEEEEEEEGEEGEEYEEAEDEEEEDDYSASIRPPIVLKFIWMEKNIGLALEMVI